MKKILLLILTIWSLSISAQRRPLHELKNISFQVEEETTLNGEKRELRYNVVIEFPDKMKKTLIYPEINKGEIYLYVHGEKTVYLPFFNQIEKTEISSEENRFLEFIKTLIEMEKNDKNFREGYYKNIDQKVELGSNEMVKIKSRRKNEDYLFPENLEIFSDNIRLSILKLSNFKSDIQLREDEFKIKK